jgi:hypothetical protein
VDSSALGSPPEDEIPTCESLGRTVEPSGDLPRKEYPLVYRPGEESWPRESSECTVVASGSLPRTKYPLVGHPGEELCARERSRGRNTSSCVARVDHSALGRDPEGIIPTRASSWGRVGRSRSLPRTKYLLLCPSGEE